MAGLSSTWCSLYWQECRYDPGINRSYQKFAEHYGVAILPTRVRKPRDKAKVEKAVKMVEWQIIAPLRKEHFDSFDALNEAIGQKLKQLNKRMMQGYGMSRRQRFEQVDQPALRPLPKYPFVLAQWKQATIRLDYHIDIERHYYSVPYWYIRCKVNAKITEKLVEIFFENQRIATHPHSQVQYRHTTIEDHMPTEHWAYKHQSKERFTAWAHRVGPQTVTQVNAIFRCRANLEPLSPALPVTFAFSGILFPLDDCAFLTVCQLSANHQRIHRAYCSSECLRCAWGGFRLYSDGIALCRLTENPSR